MVSVVKRWGLRRIFEGDLLLSSFWETGTVPLTEKERLCSLALWLRARARFVAVVSAEGASPNMKNLMKAPIRITTDSCPSRNPCVNERLERNERRVRALSGSQLTMTALLGFAKTHLKPWD